MYPWTSDPLKKYLFNATKHRFQGLSSSWRWEEERPWERGCNAYHEKLTFRGYNYRSHIVTVKLQ